MSSFYSNDELKTIGLKSFGSKVLISRFARIYNPGMVSIGSNVRIDDFCMISSNVTIGNYVHIAPYCLLIGTLGIEMEDFSGLSSRVSIYSATDDYSGAYLTNPTVPEKYTNVIGGKVTLKRHVIIGSSSIILPSVTLGEGCAVGAGSLVRNSFDDWSIIVGTPGKKIKERSKELLKLEQQFNVDRGSV